MVPDRSYLYAILMDLIDETLYHRQVIGKSGEPKAPKVWERKGSPVLDYDALIDEDTSATLNVRKWKLMLKTRALHHKRDEHTAHEMTKLILLIRANTRRS